MPHQWLRAVQRHVATTVFRRFSADLNSSGVTGLQRPFLDEGGLGRTFDGRTLHRKVFVVWLMDMGDIRSVFFFLMEIQNIR